MSDTGDTLPAAGNTKPPAKTTAQRQAALRLRRQKEGRSQVVVWLTQEEQAKVKALLAGQLGEDLAKIAAERDAMAGRLEKSRALRNELYVDVQNSQSEILAQERTIQELRLQLLKAENALKGKPERPAVTFKVPALPDRRAVIASAMTTDGYGEKSPHALKGRAELTRKFSTDIKQARSRLVSLVEIAYGVKSFDLPKNRSSLGSWQKFASPIISGAEKSLLLEACSVLRHIEEDVERAGDDVEKLHKLREAEDQARLRQAISALDQALFNGLDRRGEILFLAAMHPKSNGYGDWADLVDAAKGKEKLYRAAMETFQKALLGEKASLVRRMADTMKEAGQTAEELAKEISEKYRHPDTEEKFGAITSQVTAFLVSEQLSGSK